MDEERPHVVPIRGYEFPAPPDWKLTDESAHASRLAASVVGPDDLTLNGQIRCQAKAKNSGVRCTNAAVAGSTVCRYHGAGGKPKHPDDPGAATDPATQTRAHRIETVRLHLELVAQSAVLAVQSVLEDESAKPTDRLKAAEIVLDRTVGRHIQLEREDIEERDLDEEILSLAEALERTGTEST